MDSNPFDTIFNLCFIKIYAGTVPATADASIGSATLLCTVSNASGGTGLLWEAASVGGVLAKKVSETWSGTNVAGGTATFFRLVAAGDTAGASTTEARIQGTIAAGGADMNLGTTLLVNAATFTVNYFTQALVPS